MRCLLGWHAWKRLEDASKGERPLRFCVRCRTFQHYDSWKRRWI